MSEPTPFLLSLAQKLYGKHGRTISQVQIVLPSRRSCMYFKHYLGQVATENLLMPHVQSFNDFVSQLSPFRQPERINLLFRLYHAFSEQESLQDLELFLPIGSTLLSDFGMIDRNLSETGANQLFEYLNDVKALERWGADLEDMELLKKRVQESENIQAYFGFWLQVKAAYHRFRQSLQSENLAYGGMAYQYVAKHLEALLQAQQVGKVVFAGFFQLTNFEEAIIKQMVKQHGAEVYWDADRFYVDDRLQEAGYYLRRYRSWIPDPQNAFYEGLLTRKGKSLRLISVKNKVTQAKVVGKLLQEYVQKTYQDGEIEGFKQSINRIGILLPDENMLLPIFYSLPSLSEYLQEEGQEQTKQLADYVNITMGVKLSISPLFDLVDLMFKLQSNVQQATAGEVAFYFRDVIKLLKHPFVSMVLPAEELAVVIAEIYKANAVMVAQSSIHKKMGGQPLAATIFTDWKESPFQALACMETLCEVLSPTMQAQNLKLEYEFLKTFFKIIRNLRKALQEEREQVSIAVFRKFLMEMLQGVSVPFTGEPIAPIQVMGMLESRTLDFDHVIILSCNEGLMPPGKQTNTLIPFDVLRENRLPTHIENDASAAYTFYRLFHRSKSVTCIYTDPIAVRDGAEKSRLLTQVVEELDFEHVQEQQGEKAQAVAPEESSQWSEQVLVWSFKNKAAAAMALEKDEKVMELLRHKLKRGISPSAINQYLSNPLDFFYNSVLRIEEDKQIVESLDRVDFGTVLHNTLEAMFKNYERQTITPELLEQLIKQKKPEALYKEELEKHLPGLQHEKGKNLLLKKASIDLIYRFLNVQKKEAPFDVLLVEKFLSHLVDCPLPSGEQFRFKLAGKADRIDQKDGEVRVLDYKTGYFEKAHLSIKSLDDLYAGEKGKVLQLITYRYLVLKNRQGGGLRLPDGMPIKAGFFFFRKWSEPFIEYNWKDAPAADTDFTDAVNELLSKIVADMLNPNKPLTETPPFEQSGTSFGS